MKNFSSDIRTASPSLFPHCFQNQQGMIRHARLDLQPKKPDLWFPGKAGVMLDFSNFVFIVIIRESSFLSRLFQKQMRVTWSMIVENCWIRRHSSRTSQSSAGKSH